MRTPSLGLVLRGELTERREEKMSPETSVAKWYPGHRRVTHRVEGNSKPIVPRWQHCSEVRGNVTDVCPRVIFSYHAQTHRMFVGLVTWSGDPSPRADSLMDVRVKIATRRPAGLPISTGTSKLVCSCQKGQLS